MTRQERLVVATVFTAILVFLSGAPAAGQEHEPASENTVAEHHSPEKEFHRNHFGGLLGVSTHLDTDDTAATLGLEYARQLSPHWALAVYTEMVSSSLERDFIVAVGGIFYPVRRLGLVLAVGAESAAIDVDHHGETVTEDEFELLLRMGAAYGFRVTAGASLGPVVQVDNAGERWTVVVGVGMVVGF